MSGNREDEMALRGWRAQAFLSAMLVPAIVLVFAGPIPQSANYHDFADTRFWLGIPNAADVLSNLPFVLVGLAGLVQLRQRAPRIGHLSWNVFFAGVFLVAFGSMYYHWAPDDARLVWDRLPMTLAFMAFFTVILVRHVGAIHERWILPLSLAAGLLSVAWWVATGDLRFYIWIQAAPFLAVMAMIALFRDGYPNRRFLVLALGAYTFSKLAEFGDLALFESSAHIVSGHSLKHVLAALSVMFVALMQRRDDAATLP